MHIEITNLFIIYLIGGSKLYIKSSISIVYKGCKRGLKVWEIYEIAKF